MLFYFVSSKSCMNQMANEVGKRRLIVVTGYGSFSTYRVNPAQVIVEMVGSSKSLINDLSAQGVDLLTRIVDVDYANAAALSKEICEELKADFVIHVGVHPKKRCVMLESLAFNDGYMSADIRGTVPLRNCCSLTESLQEPEKSPSKVLKTCLNCERLKEEICNDCEVVKEGSLCVQTSTDPGRFLCGYIYYCSLLLNSGRSLFVHVPDFETTEKEDEEVDDECSESSTDKNQESQPITPENLTEVLKAVICNVLKQMN